MNRTIQIIGWSVFTAVILMGLFGWLIPQRAYPMGGHGGGYYSDHMSGYNNDSRGWNGHNPGYGTDSGDWSDHMNDSYHYGPENNDPNSHMNAPNGYYNREDGYGRNLNEPEINRNH